MHVVVIGSGIAGATCAESLAVAWRNQPEHRITLLSASPMLKTVANFHQLSRTLETFEIVERWLDDALQYPNLSIVHATVASVDTRAKSVLDTAGRRHAYDKLSVCAGARPNLIATAHPEHVIGIRDTESVKDLQARLGSARRVVVVGNGGIALELVHEVQFCDVVWAVRDEHIGTSFFDAGAATFFMSDVKLESAGMSENESTATLRHGLPEEPEETENGVAIFTPHTLQQRAAKAALASARAGVSDIPSSQAPPEPNQTAPAMEVYSGAALGPRWQDQARLHPIGERIDTPRRVVELSTSVSAVLSPAEFVAYRQQHPAIVHNDTDILDWPAIVVLSNNRVYGCDVVVSATGVVPCADFIGPEILRASDGGIAVNDQMQTNLPDVFAAGDVCTVQWPTSSHWFQLRLWTQARQMGAYAARCIQAAAKHELALLDFCFEAFAHVTRFFGFKVVLLGLYNAQGLAVGDYEVLLRVTRGHEYIKLVLANGCVQGAVLIGETDLEETFENLILNQLDVSAFKDMLLDPDVDVEDYFD